MKRPVNRGDVHEPGSVRIIGGRFRRHRLLYSGDPRTRPMKDRVREAVFNLLGYDVEGKHVLDLFAGTGVLAFEAISRGAVRGTLLEQHFPSADIIRRNAAELGVGEVVEVVAGNTFIWAKRFVCPDPTPWLVFCSPPFSFYRERLAEMRELHASLVEQAPPRSVFVVETEAEFDLAEFSDLPWETRAYPPAAISIWTKP